MVTYVGLYYPFIHFRDEGWLKLTALYWDGMRRIVPVGASVHDSDEVRRLVDAGFIQSKLPLDAAFQIAGPFRELINTHGDTMPSVIRGPTIFIHGGMLPDATLSSLTSSTRRWIPVFSAISSATDSSLAGATTRAGLACIRGWLRSTWCRWLKRWRPLWARIR